MSVPPHPALGALRMATPSDILRIGLVATASFRNSPLFRWERPHHDEFPDDNLLSYRKQFTNAMENKEMIVLVAEDAFIPNENDYTKAIIPSGNGWTPPAEGDKVVVGVASFKLGPGSNRRGQFQSDQGEYPELPPYLGRDLNRKHYDSWGDKVGAAKKSYCSGFSSMNMLAVHPAYWKRGHGTKLVNWGINLCKLDHATQSVSAADMEASLYKSLGYTFICKVEADGDEDDSEGVFTELLKFRSCEPPC